MKILNVIKNIIVVFVVASFLFVIAMLGLGFKGYSVVTDSMAPTIKKGYAVFTKYISFEQLKTGDIVTVKLGNNGNTFTHRVVEIDRENNVFYTQGDNSSTKDGASDANDLLGKVVFSIPLVGYLSIAFSNRIVLAATLAFFVVAFTVLKILLVVFSKKKGVTEK